MSYFITIVRGSFIHNYIDFIVNELLNYTLTYPEFKAEFERLGLRKYSSVETRSVAFQQLILEWGAVVEGVRTISSEGMT